MDPANLPDDWWRHGELRIEFQQENTKQNRSKAFDRYELYKHSSTVAEAMKNGATREDLQNDLRRSLLTVTSTEADADTMRKLRSVKRNLTSPEKASTASCRQKHNIGIPPSMSDEEFGDAAAAPSASNDGPATLAAIEGLLEVKLNPVAASIHGLQTEFVGLSVSVDERLRAMDLRINAADVRIEKLEQLIEVRPAPPTYDGKLAEQMFFLPVSVHRGKNNITKVGGRWKGPAMGKHGPCLRRARRAARAAGGLRPRGCTTPRQTLGRRRLDAAASITMSPGSCSSRLRSCLSIRPRQPWTRTWGSAWPRCAARPQWRKTQHRTRTRQRIRVKTPSRHRPALRWQPPHPTGRCRKNRDPSPAASAGAPGVLESS